MGSKYNKYTEKAKRNIEPAIEDLPVYELSRSLLNRRTLYYSADQYRKNQDIQSGASVFSAEFSYRPNFQKPQTNSQHNSVLIVVHHKTKVSFPWMILIISAGKLY